MENYIQSIGSVQNENEYSILSDIILQYCFPSFHQLTPTHWYVMFQLISNSKFSEEVIYSEYF